MKCDILMNVLSRYDCKIC